SAAGVRGWRARGGGVGFAWKSEWGLGGTEADPASAASGEGIGGLARLDRERRLRAGHVVDRPLAQAAPRAVVRGELPVVRGETGRRARVVVLDARVVLLHADGVAAERFVVHAVEADARPARHGQAVGNHEVQR